MRASAREDERVRRTLGTQSSWLLSQEPWTTNSWTGEDSWRFNADRDIAKCDGVETFDEYWRARERHLDDLHALDASPRPSLGLPVVRQPTTFMPNEQRGTRTGPKVAAQRPLAFLGLMLTPLLAVLAVVQATSAVTAQIIGSVLAAIMMITAVVCRATCHRRRARYTLLAVLLLPGLGVAATVIAGYAAA